VAVDGVRLKRRCERRQRENQKKEGEALRQHSRPTSVSTTVARMIKLHRMPLLRRPERFTFSRRSRIFPSAVQALFTIDRESMRMNFE